MEQKTINVWVVRFIKNIVKIFIGGGGVAIILAMLLEYFLLIQKD